MGKKQLWYLILALILLNILTILYFLFKEPKYSHYVNSKDEQIATVGDVAISRQNWLEKLERYHGEDVLENLIDHEVIVQAAKKYDIKVTDKEIELEYNLASVAYGLNEGSFLKNNALKEEIKYTLLLEKLLTKDVTISSSDIENYYEENKAFFNMPTLYRVSRLIVTTNREAEQVIKELNEGSNFSVIAMERSLDKMTASTGGEMGFISDDNKYFSKNVMDDVRKLKPGEFTNPIKIQEGYLIVYLQEIITHKKYSLSDVESHIHRQLALEQMNVPMSARSLWDEMNVKWFFGKNF